MMTKHTETNVLVAIYAVTAALWVFFVAYTGHTALYEGPIFEYVLKPFLIGMTVLPLVGGWLGIRKALLWGGLRSAVGRGMIFLSLGTISWGLGMVVWNYYLFFTGTEVPYPSLADLFFIMIWIFWTYGMFQMGKATGVKFGFRSAAGKILSFVLPLVVIFLSYYLLVTVAKGGQIDISGNLAQTLLEFLYPIGDMAILSTAFLVFFLSYRYLGGMYKGQIRILLFCFVLNYIADLIFVFTTAGEAPTYFNGHLVDLLYTTIMFLVSVSVCLIDPRKLNRRSS